MFYYWTNQLVPVQQVISYQTPTLNMAKSLEVKNVQLHLVRGRSMAVVQPSVHCVWFLRAQLLFSSSVSLEVYLILLFIQTHWRVRRFLHSLLGQQLLDSETLVSRQGSKKPSRACGAWWQRREERGGSWRTNEKRSGEEASLRPEEQDGQRLVTSMTEIEVELGNNAGEIRGAAQRNKHKNDLGFQLKVPARLQELLTNMSPWGGVSPTVGLWWPEEREERKKGGDCSRGGGHTPFGDTVCDISTL